MAMLASKASFPNIHSSISTQPSLSSASYNSSASSYKPARGGPSNEGIFASPTESEFSEVHDASDSLRSWDEKKVAEWLHSIRCGQYESIFKANNLNGNNLLECDQKILQEIGIKKIGDRVRIFVAIKQLRNKALSSRKKRNRDSLAMLDAPTFTPSSVDSPRPLNIKGQNAGARRWSRQIDGSAFQNMGLKSTSRPTSPMTETENRALRSHRYLATSPIEGPRNPPGYFSNPSSANSTTSRGPTTPGEPIKGPSHLRQTSNLDGTMMSTLPANSPVIRVIHAGGQTKVLNIKSCKTYDEIMTYVLKKLGLPESHYKNYCFYVLDGTEPVASRCRRLSEGELLHVCETKSQRTERNRLILRKIHAGEPDIEELRRAAQLVVEDTTNLAPVNYVNSANIRNQIKLQKLTGESWSSIKQPMSPATSERTRNLIGTADDLERPGSSRAPARANSKLREFFGARPPSEMIIHELTSYFPQHEKEKIEKTMRMSVRRSQRLSRAASRISIMSNASFASSMKDVPPIPSIADAWLTSGGAPTRASRPLSVSKLSLPQTSFRDSMMSLQPLQEEENEPDRKSYVSFDSSSESANQTLDNDNISRQSFYDENASVAATDGHSSLNEHLSLLVAEDGEEEDAGLNSFLAGNNFDKMNWMKGSLIGEGSFGKVYLALHSITGELMAVKQVEIPNVAKGTEIDKKKNVMVTALKHEIELLQGLRHKNIVQYLGTSNDESHLNIFLEYVPGGSIAVMLLQYSTFHEPLIRNFVRQILDGLSYLHGRDIIHRDIKGANVLVDNKGGIKISDFGISKRVEASSMLGSHAVGNHLNRPSLQGSVFWMAPEVVRQTAHTKKADIWSLGCLIVEMFSGAHPFPNCSQLQAIFAIGSNQAKPTTPETCSEPAQDFLNKTFEIDHMKRPDAEELLKHPFLEPMA